MLRTGLGIAVGAALLAALCSAAVGGVSAPLDTITLEQRRGQHRVFVDSSGRERLFHGSSAVVKGPPWVPDSRTFSHDISMAKEDFEWMAALGLNVLRLGVFWAGLEPNRGRFNETYLDELERVLDLAAAHGVYVFLDMHQDGLSELFCGEGFPAWAIRRQPPALQFPYPYAPPFNESDMYDEHAGQLGRIPRRSACGADHGPDYGQWTREAAGAYQAIYSNWDGLGDAFAAAWAKIARRFAHRPEILGLELLNEPFAGDFYSHVTNETNWMNSTLMKPYPNPFNADAQNLQPLFDRVNAAVRRVDDEVLLFFAGVIWDNDGAGFTAPPGGTDYANRSVLSYHYYSPPQTTVQRQFESFRQSARRLQVAAFMTESDHAPGRETDGNYSRHIVGDVADRYLQSWATWEWKNFFRGESIPPSQLASQYGAHVTGNAPAWPLPHDGSPPAPTFFFQKAYARTYAPAVAGKLLAMHFDVRNSDFKLVYVVTRNDSLVPTEIFVSELWYPSNFSVVATPSSGKVRVDYTAGHKHTWVLVYALADVSVGSTVQIAIASDGAAL